MHPERLCLLSHNHQNNWPFSEKVMKEIEKIESRLVIATMNEANELPA
jgi:hypothetical protein